MYLNVVFIPFFSALIVGFFGRKLGSKGSGLVTTCCIGLTFFISLFIFYEVGFQGSPCYIHLLNWIDLEFFSIFFFKHNYFFSYFWIIIFFSNS